MRFSLTLWAFSTCLWLSNAQQYAGDVISTNLPMVPGSEITFFKVADVTGKNSNLTLINYYSHGIGNRRLVESKVQRAIIMIHGLNRDPGIYMSYMLSALAQSKSDPNINSDSVAILATYFPNGDDKKIGYPWTDGLAAGRGSTTNCLVWPGSRWSAGGNNQYPFSSKGSTSSYTVLDQLVQYFDDRALFPNMKQIVVAGHSLGAQTVQRYAAIGNPLNTQSPISYWVGNPNSYAWLSTDRPFSTASCPTYDDYREGFNKFIAYPMTYGTSLVSQGRAAIQANFNSKAINYARGTHDLGDTSSSCAPGTTGSNRNERFFNFIKAFPPSCSEPAGHNCDTIDLVNMGHDGGGMVASAAGQARLFSDNFYGDDKRSYDFGYPRQQAGDDPFPDPALNTTASSTNNNTYAGNMTYWGCWSDQNPQTLTNMIFENDANTVELCTKTCADAGSSIAGLKNGKQCFCGKALGYMATQVVESSCSSTCPGNSTENCGGSNRLSIFSAGRPASLEAPSTPETIGDYYYASCYTEATSGRALIAKATNSPSMTLDFCATFCTGHAYFGTEYGSECYCGNGFSAGAVRTAKVDCNMLCANATNQFCGAGNRLTVYNNPAIVVSSSTSSTSSSATAAPSAGSSSISCPAANGTTVTSAGSSFLVECGIDHAGGDIASATVSSFQGCIDACANNGRCVDVSLSGTACYLKGTLGASISNDGVWGAKLVMGQLGSELITSSSTSSSSTSSSSTTSTESSASTSSASTTSSSTTSSSTAFSSTTSSTTTPTGSISNSSNFPTSTSSSSMSVVSASVVSSTLSISSSSSSSSIATSVSSSVASDSASTSSSISTSGTTSPAAPSASAPALSCPASNSTTYTSNSRAFTIECGVDYRGGDMKAVSAKDLTECANACATTDGCVAAAFLGAACYLKSTVGARVYNGVQGVRRIENVSSLMLSSTNTSSSSSSTSSSSNTSSSSSTNASQSGSFAASSILSATTFLISATASISPQASLGSTSSSIASANNPDGPSSVPTLSPTGMITYHSAALTTVPVASAPPLGYSSIPACFVDPGATRVVE